MLNSEHDGEYFEAEPVVKQQHNLSGQLFAFEEENEEAEQQQRKKEELSVIIEKECACQRRCSNEGNQADQMEQLQRKIAEFDRLFKEMGVLKQKEEQAPLIEEDSDDEILDNQGIDNYILKNIEKNQQRLKVISQEKGLTDNMAIEQELIKNLSSHQTYYKQ